MRRFKSALGQSARDHAEGGPAGNAPVANDSAQRGSARSDQSGGDQSEDGTSSGNKSRNGNAKTVEAAAVRLLMRREHSPQELRRKLARKGHPLAVVEVVIAKLGDQNLLSETRFVANFIRYRAGRGQGPVRIRAELRQQGIADTLIEAALENSAVDWLSIVTRLRVRKFSAAAPKGMAERAKQTRFLQYRGFSSEHIRAAFCGSNERLAISDESIVDGFE